MKNVELRFAPLTRANLIVSLVFPTALGLILKQTLTPASVEDCKAMQLTRVCIRKPSRPSGRCCATLIRASLKFYILHSKF